MSEFLVLPYVLGMLIKDGKVLLLRRSHTGFGDGCMHSLEGRLMTMSLPSKR